MWRPQSQLAYLSRYHCDQIQGYYFSRPLPVPELEQLLQNGTELAAPEHEARRKTLLILDGDEHASRSLRDLLRRDGYTILLAASADVAFDVLAQHRVQVLLCDEHESTMSSAEFLGRVRELHPDVLRIVVTAHADLESIMDAVNRAGIYRFYTKPWDDRELRNNIRGRVPSLLGVARQHDRAARHPSARGDLRRPARLTLGAKGVRRDQGFDVISPVHAAATLGSHGSHRCAGAAADLPGGFTCLPPVVRAMPFAHLALIAAVVAATVGGTAVTPVVADHDAPAGSVTLVGSLQSELGCADDWSPPCPATALQPADDGAWSLTVDVPAGSWEWKVALDGGGTAATRRPTCRWCWRPRLA